MTNYFLFYILLFLTILSACSEKNASTDQETSIDVVSLPNDLSAIPDSLFSPLNSLLNDAHIIGVSEGSHGMNEPLDFRNSFIRYMVKNNRINVIAFESGLLESRMVNDFIQGKEIDLDSVLKNGISYGFGQLKQNRELLLWLRNVNLHRDAKDRVRFYGFDMAGNAPNPYLEESGFALSVCLHYLHQVDPKTYHSFNEKLEKYLPYLHVDDSPEDNRLSYTDLKKEQRVELQLILAQLANRLEKNKRQYIAHSGKEEYLWGQQAARCAKQNIAFLGEISSPNADQHTREKFMFDNLSWILEKEKEQRVLIFAHLAHLSKDIYGLNESGENTIPHNMLGEYIREAYGTSYKLIGNIYSSLNYSNGTENVKAGTLPMLISNRSKSANFYLQTRSNDSLFNSPRIFGVPTPSKGDLWMTPYKGADIILYTAKQHDCFI